MFQTCTDVQGFSIYDMYVPLLFSYGERRSGPSIHRCQSLFLLKEKSDDAKERE